MQNIVLLDNLVHVLLDLQLMVQLLFCLQLHTPQSTKKKSREYLELGDMHVQLQPNVQ